MNWMHATRTVGLLLALVALPAWAAVPTTVAVEGRLMAAGGGPVADGQYDVEFALYASQTAATPLWKEAAKAVAVKGGVFGYTLGGVAPLGPEALAGAGAGGVWLGVKVGADPEVGRKAVASAPYALRAAVAEGLQCSGCVGAMALDAAVLAPYAKKAELPDAAKTGNYGDLNNLPVLAKVGTSCGSGMVVKGLKADGALECVAGSVAGGKCAVGEVVVEVKADGGVVCAKPGVVGGKCKVGEVVTEVKGDGAVVCGPPTLANGKPVGEAIGDYLSSLECRGRKVTVGVTSPFSGKVKLQPVAPCSKAGFLLGIAHQYAKGTGNLDFLQVIGSPADGFTAGGDTNVELACSGSSATLYLDEVAKNTLTFSISAGNTVQFPQWAGTCTTAVVCCEPSTTL